MPNPHIIPPHRAKAAVKRDGLAIQYVRKQTPAICLAAVRQYGGALPYVRKQTEAICLAAVRECGQALRFVRNQTPAICLAAVKEDREALRYVMDGATYDSLDDLLRNKPTPATLRTRLARMEALLNKKGIV
jgi:hypothetical protein